MRYTAPSNYFNNDTTILAGTIYGEARGASDAEKEDVIRVILNRVKAKRGGTCIADVCLAPLQFSSWNYNDPNRVKILTAPQKDPKVFQKCLDLAKKAIKGLTADRVNGAINYYDKTLDNNPPYWAKAHAILTYKTDNFRYYKNC